ncbi:MAG: hypothetical protein M1414_04750 [Candidatus Thermoplasmatota archaeon]|jgi:hypothetical protein|nr:hypothetical protein [Candidatus Thermoplasmatota archaeon]MCL5988196.1 hypothetical protein [Candidatus Thermoplasmatota archaeon]
MKKMKDQIIRTLRRMVIQKGEIIDLRGAEIPLYSIIKTKISRIGIKYSTNWTEFAIEVNLFIIYPETINDNWNAKYRIITDFFGFPSVFFASIL